MAMRSRFEADRQLTARMVVTMFLLGLVYVAFVAALIVLLKSVVLGLS
jgi:heat shock protein HtpX